MKDKIVNQYLNVKFKRFSSSDYEITTKKVTIYNTEIDRTRKDIHTIKSAERSVQRSHKKVYDILRSNEWQYFLTLTFGTDDRASDQACRDLFSKWQHNIRRRFPNLYYIAVPEYHKKGSIHYHVVIGGTSSKELQLKNSGKVYHNGKAWRKKDFIKAGFEFKPEIGEGVPIYNVFAWNDIGFSTATEVRSNKAVCIYVSKYLTKAHIDPRFFNKRRFYTSHNISLPVVRSFGLNDFTSDFVQFGDLIFGSDSYQLIKPAEDQFKNIDTILSTY